MVPLDPAAARHIRTRLGLSVGPGLLALRHALAYRRPGLWGDDPVAPRSVLLVREGDGRIEAFGAGEPWPGLGWLIGHGRGFVLSAPDDWLTTAAETLKGDVERVEVETWSLDSLAPDVPDTDADSPAQAKAKAAPHVVVRRLTAGDRSAFAAVAPAWALRGWQSYSALIEHGAAFGVPHGSGFAAFGWVFDQADTYDAVGVFTTPRYRRLGLGRASALAAITHIFDRRGKSPLWSFPPDHDASLSLASSLGFSPAAAETVMYHPPRVAP